jgi:hypothetical protein
LLVFRKWPTALAEAPKPMNTIENPAMKATADAIRLPRGFSPRCNCSTPMPESIEMYPGTSGSTHGDKNEISPATSAAKIETRIARTFSVKTPQDDCRPVANRIIFAQ